MIDPTDLPTLKTRLRALLADTPHPAHPHVSPADLTAILDELDAGESERARHAEEIERLRRERDELRAQREELRSAISRQATRHMQRVERLESELTARRALDADVVACAEHLVEPVSCLPSGLRERARRILAAKDAGVIGHCREGE